MPPYNVTTPPVAPPAQASYGTAATLAEQQRSNDDAVNQSGIQEFKPLQEKSPAFVLGEMLKRGWDYFTGAEAKKAAEKAAEKAFAKQEEEFALRAAEEAKTPEAKKQRRNAVKAAHRGEENTNARLYGEGQSKKARQRRAAVAATETMFGDTAIVTASQGGLVNVTNITESNPDIRSVFANFDNPEGAPAGEPSIVGKSAIISTDNVPVAISVGGRDVRGIAVKDDANPNVFRLPASGLDVVVDAGGIRIANLGESASGGENVIEVAGVTVGNPTQANSIENTLGIYPNTPASIAQAPYHHTIALPPYLVGAKLYHNGDGGFAAFVQDNGNLGFAEELPDSEAIAFPRILRLNFNARGMLDSAQSVFDIRNTGTPHTASDVLISVSPEVPVDGVPLSGADTFSINSFYTEAAADGGVAVAVQYFRGEDRGTKYGANTELVAAVRVFNPEGYPISSVRAGAYAVPSISKGSVDKKRGTVAAFGGTAAGDVFVDFGIGGAPQATGHLVSGANSSLIEDSLLSDNQNLQNPPRNTIRLDGATIQISGANLDVSSLDFSAAELAMIGRQASHVVLAGEEYQTSFEAGARGYVFVPANATGTKITFIDAGDYVFVNNSIAPVDLRFPAIEEGFTGDLQVVNVDGVPSTVAHFPGGVNVTFFGENLEHVQGFIAGISWQTSTTITTTPATTPTTAAATTSTTTTVTTPTTTAVTTPDTQPTTTTAATTTTTTTTTPVTTPVTTPTTTAVTTPDTQPTTATTTPTTTTTPATAAATTTTTTTAAAATTTEAPNARAPIDPLTVTAMLFGAMLLTAIVSVTSYKAYHRGRNRVDPALDLIPLDRMNRRGDGVVPLGDGDARSRTPSPVPQEPGGVRTGASLAGVVSSSSIT